MRQLRWVAASREEVQSLPDRARRTVGYALYLAQYGDKHPDAKPLKGFGGAGVVEVVADQSGSTYRAVYTLTLSNAVYVLCAFQKKSTHGTATPKRLIDLVHHRLTLAEELARQAEQDEATPE